MLIGVNELGTQSRVSVYIIYDCTNREYVIKSYVTHTAADRSKENDSVHLSHAKVVSHCSCGTAGQQVCDNSASLLIPPVVAKTRGVKEACSISRTRSPYSLFFSCS